MHNNGESIVVERILNAPVEHVWQAFTDPELLKRWFAKEAKVVAERGGPYELFWEPANPERNSTLGCRVTHAEPQRWLAFTWRGPTIYDDPMNEGDPRRDLPGRGCTSRGTARAKLPCGSST